MNIPQGRENLTADSAGEIADIAEIAVIARDWKGKTLQGIENQFMMIAGRSEEHEVFVGSHSCSGADPSGPARKLKKALARGRTSRDGNPRVAAFSK
jgi:hypothetical protein